MLPAAAGVCPPPPPLFSSFSLPLLDKTVSNSLALLQLCDDRSIMEPPPKVLPLFVYVYERSDALRPRAASSSTSVLYSSRIRATTGPGKGTCAAPVTRSSADITRPSTTDCGRRGREGGSEKVDIEWQCDAKVPYKAVWKGDAWQAGVILEHSAAAAALLTAHTLN